MYNQGVGTIEARFSSVEHNDEIRLHALTSNTFPNIGILEFLEFIDAVGMYKKT